MTQESKFLFQKILSTKEVLAMADVSHATLYATLLKRLNFPKPFKIGLRKNAWFRVEVEAWIVARAKATV